MSPKHRTWVVVVIAIGSASCAPSIDIPPPPDLQPFLTAFDEPTANVTSVVMASHAEEIDELSQGILDSEVLEQFVEIVESVRRELEENTDDQGNLVLDGTPFPSPNGLVTISHVCTGWDRDSNEVDADENGMFEIFMPLTDGRVGPDVWGSSNDCKYLVGGSLQSSFDGDIALHVGRLVDPESNLRELTLTLLIEGILGIRNDDIAVLQSFRLTSLGRLEILLLVENVGSFVYFFEPERLRQGIRDVTGSFDCSLEERQCAKDSGVLSW